MGIFLIQIYQNSCIVRQPLLITKQSRALTNRCGICFSSWRHPCNTNSWLPSKHCTSDPIYRLQAPLRNHTIIGAVVLRHFNHAQVLVAQFSQIGLCFHAIKTIGTSSATSLTKQNPNKIGRLPLKSPYFYISSSDYLVPNSHCWRVVESGANST